MKSEILKKIHLVVAITLFISCLPFPYGFYTLSRLIVFISIGILIYDLYRFHQNNTNQIIILGIIGLLFNPIFPVYLNNKFLWILIDLGLGISFFRKFLKS